MKRRGQPIIPTNIISCLLLLLILLIYVYFGYHRYDYYGDDAPVPNVLHPVVEQKRAELVARAKEENIAIIITETIRSFERQNKLYDQGRTTAGDIVTYARGGESYHNYGLAIDFAIEDADGNLTWDIHYDGNGNHLPDWDEVVAIAKELGFEWGGDWDSFKDYPHLQMTFGLSIKQLQRGFRPKAEILE